MRFPLRRKGGVIDAHHQHASWGECSNQLAEQNPASFAARPNRSVEHAMIGLEVLLLAQPHHS
jgi:hypothetical protein